MLFDLLDKITAKYLSVYLIITGLMDVTWWLFYDQGLFEACYTTANMVIMPLAIIAVIGIVLFLIDGEFEDAMTFLVMNLAMIGVQFFTILWLQGNFEGMARWSVLWAMICVLIELITVTRLANSRYVDCSLAIGRN